MSKIVHTPVPSQVERSKHSSPPVEGLGVGRTKTFTLFKKFNHE